MQVKEREVIDHGISHAQYFQGCGTSFTRYTHAFTGAGCSAYEAMEDALEQAASAGFELYSSSGRNVIANRLSKRIPKEIRVQPEDGELYCYVTVRIKER